MNSPAAANSTAPLARREPPRDRRAAALEQRFGDRGGGTDGDPRLLQSGAHCRKYPHADIGIRRFLLHLDSAKPTGLASRRSGCQSAKSEWMSELVRRRADANSAARRGQRHSARHADRHTARTHPHRVGSGARAARAAGAAGRTGRFERERVRSRWSRDASFARGRPRRSASPARRRTAATAISPTSRRAWSPRPRRSRSCSARATSPRAWVADGRGRARRARPRCPQPDAARRNAARGARARAVGRARVRRLPDQRGELRRVVLERGAGPRVERAVLDAEPL